MSDVIMKAWKYLPLASVIFCEDRKLWSRLVNGELAFIVSDIEPAIDAAGHKTVSEAVAIAVDTI